MATLGEILGTSTSRAENQYVQQLLAGALMTPKAPTLQSVNLPMYGTGEQFQYMGDYTPEAMSATELRNLILDPAMRAQELATLEQLNQIVSGGGLTDIDVARLAEIRAQQAAQERGGRQAIQQNLAQRGLAGAGSELAAYLQSQQSGADRAALEGANVAAEAQARQLQAGLQRGQLAGNISERDYARSAQRAQAQDIINRFNVENRNLAQMSNLERQQAINNLNKQLAQANIDTRQRQEIMNKLQIPMSQYGLTSQESGTKLGLLGQAAGTRLQGAQQRAQQMQNLIGTGIQAGATYLGGPAGGLVVGNTFIPGAESRGSQLLNTLSSSSYNPFNWQFSPPKSAQPANTAQPATTQTGVRR
jgi:hypothetical protein